MPRESERRSFRYQQRSRDDLRERANMRGGNFDSYIKSKFKMFKPKTGKNMIRILPPTWDEAKHFGYDIWVNYGIGVDNQSYLSLAEMRNEADPIAEARKSAEREGDKELSDQLKPKRRIVYWLIDRNSEDEGPLLWAAPWTFDKDLANVCFDEDTKEIVFIDDPEKGNDLRFYKEGEGLKTTYEGSRMKIMPAGPVHEDEELQEEWLTFIQDNPIPECLQFYDYDHIASVFNGKTSRREKDEDEEKEVAPRSRRREAEAKLPWDEDEEDSGVKRTVSRKSRSEPESEEEAEAEEKPPERRGLRARISAARRPAMEDAEEE
jgi:hypothetical protein